MGSNHSVACSASEPARAWKSWENATNGRSSDKSRNGNSGQTTNGAKSHPAPSIKQSLPSMTNKLSSSINRFMDSSKNNNNPGDTIMAQARRTLEASSRGRLDVNRPPGSSKHRKCQPATSSTSAQLLAGKAHNGCCSDSAARTGRKVTYGLASESGRQAPLSSADAMERRRECFKNGDVFIYPAIYKNMNECQMCSRDNRICNCNSANDDDDADCKDQVGDAANQLCPSAMKIVSQVGKQQSSPPGGLATGESTGTPRKGPLGVGQRCSEGGSSAKLTIVRVAAIQEPSKTSTSDQGEDGAEDRIPLVGGDAMEQTDTSNGCVAASTMGPNARSEQTLTVRACDQRMRTGAQAATAAASDSSLKFGDSLRSHSVNSTANGLNESESIIFKPISRQQTSESFKLTSNDPPPASENNNSEVTSQTLTSGERDVNNNELGPSSKKVFSLDRKGSISKGSSVSDCEKTMMKEYRSGDEEADAEEDEEERLTCNMTVGEPIKITSTSIRIGANQIQTLSPTGTSIVCTGLNHTSVVPIQTLSTKRKNLAIKLNHQAIQDDSDFIAELMLNNSEQMQAQRIILPATMSITDSPAAFLSQEKINDTLEYSPILTSARDYIKNVNTELQVQTVQSSEQAAILPSIVATNQVVDEPTLVVTPLKLGTVENPNIPTATISIHPTELESPKKSIFDGASKDEILEYLEDARERVPEILMAADDVMVINENELIVVNQLGGANSPATPISIVETTETTSRIGTPDNPDNDTHAHPDQLRQHLAQMYQTSQLANSHLTSSIEDAPDTSHSQIGCSESLSSNNLIDSSSQGLGSIRQRGELKGFSRATGETLDSLEDQTNSIDIIDSQKSEEPEKSTQLCDQTLVTDSSNRSSLRRNLRTTDSSISYASSTSDPSNSLGLMHYDHPISIYDGRRKSEDSSTQTDRKSALQLIMLQQRYSNRDSLSSSASSPPSSASPASSTSSNQTSGNCSAASNFYASSSLSCSSPFLDLSNKAGYGSTALNQGLQVSNATSEIKDIEYDNNLLESLIRGVKSEDSSEIVEPRSPQAERDDSGLGQDSQTNIKILQQASTTKKESPIITKSVSDQLRDECNTAHCILRIDPDKIGKLSVIQETSKSMIPEVKLSKVKCLAIEAGDANTSIDQQEQTIQTYASTANLVSRTNYGHYATMNKLNNYFVNRHPFVNSKNSSYEFQCLDCDQFIDVDHAKMLSKTTDLRTSREPDWITMASQNQEIISKDKPLTTDQLDRAYIAAMNGLPLCKLCEKKRIERKEIISEFVETELKYGRDLKIIHDEFYRPMQIAGLLSKDQIHGVFSNLEELIVAHCKFADRLGIAISEAHSMGDTDYNTVNIGRLFLDSAEMLNTFESYCIRQGTAACLLARLAKEKELLRIFLRVSQMENTLLRRMNLAAFLMVPVQRVTKYPLLLNRLYKVTAYHHKDREALRDAQLKVELHLEHINQQTKGVGATNKIWRRISNLSAPIANRRGLMNAEDIGQIKLRKTAMDLLKWDRDETQFIHSGKLNFAPLNEFLIKQKMKPLRYMAAHALLVVLGKPNWKYRLDLVKSNLDSKLMAPTPGGNGVKEAALMLFREKNGRFVPCREPLLLSSCVLSNDCSKYNSECPLNHPNHNSKTSTNSGQNNLVSNGASNRKIPPKQADSREAVSERKPGIVELISSAHSTTLERVGPVARSSSNKNDPESSEQRSNSINGDTASMSSLKSSLDDPNIRSYSPPSHSSRSCSLASALPGTAMMSATSALSIPKSTSISTNQNILNQLKTKVNNYHKQATNAHKADTKSSNMQSSCGQIDAGCTNAGSTGSNQNHVNGDLHTSNNSSLLTSTSSVSGSSMMGNSAEPQQQQHHHQHYSHHLFHNHHQPYGDYEESFEIHERLSKESMLLRADTPLKTRYWLQLLRYHAKDLGHWRQRRNGLANIMMMRQD